MTSMKSVEKIKDLLRIQGQNGNWNFDPYMHGLYNGLEIALSILENREPVYREKPTDGWIADRVKHNKSSNMFEGQVLT